MKIALAQLNYTIGDFSNNMSVVRKAVARAREGRADLLVFSELAVCGYPPLDLLERKDFTLRSLREVENLASETDEGLGILIGGPDFNLNPEGKLLYNAAFFLHGGKVQEVFHKSLLPTYDIFDEYRHFQPSASFRLLNFKGKKIAVTICEDLWDEQPFESTWARSRLYTVSPMDELARFNPDFIINMAASPFSHTKQAVKQSIFTGKAKKHGIPVFYCNQTGAQTELIFEGGSMAIDATGKVAQQLAFFEEDFRIIPLEDLLQSSATPEPELPGRISLVHSALVCGIRDYFMKSGLKKATLGLSGGIDSAVTLALATEALGKENMHVLLLPSQYSSGHSVSDSVEMAEGLGVGYHILSIKDLFELYKEVLQPVFGDRPEDLAEENIQARIRGTLLMALSNKLGHILLNTSNKSETAVGYGTLYGDMSGGLSVLGDLYKTDVYRLAEYINRDREIIPRNIITKAPSAELRPDQKDSDSLPEYSLLDEVLECYIEKQMTAEEIAAKGYNPELVNRIIRLVNFNEYKRYQTPPILRISSKAFGVGRRVPLVGKY
ncbi:MAG: NAD+ synthase [Bacteroidota bacterium]